MTEIILNLFSNNMKQAKFDIGQIVHHRRFDYRGVIYDVDPEFYGTEEWYAMVATSQPPKDEPWYKVLVDKAEHKTYVAECNLEETIEELPIDHPMLENYFSDFFEGRYWRIYSSN